MTLRPPSQPPSDDPDGPTQFTSLKQVFTLIATFAALLLLTGLVVLVLALVFL